MNHKSEQVSSRRKCDSRLRKLRNTPIPAHCKSTRTNRQMSQLDPSHLRASRPTDGRTRISLALEIQMENQIHTVYLHALLPSKLIASSPREVTAGAGRAERSSGGMPPGEAGRSAAQHLRLHSDARAKHQKEHTLIQVWHVSVNLNNAQGSTKQWTPKAPRSEDGRKPALNKFLQLFTPTLGCIQPVVVRSSRWKTTTQLT